MRIAISGASGLIGRVLCQRLAADHEVIRLVRRPAASQLERRWDPVAGYIESLGLSDIDAVINLSGAGIADRRWDTRRRRELLTSRVEPTRTLARLIAEEERPAIFLSASAVGYYGDTGQATIDETAPTGGGFLADVCRAWEDAAAVPGGRSAEVRTTLLRTGIVLDRHGGFLGKQLPLFRAGLGGPLGDGRQWLPWITVADEVGAIEHLLTAEVSGPVNLVAPNPVTNAEFTAALARAVRRPARLRVPPAALRLALGEGLTGEAILAGNRIVPARLIESGYRFRTPQLAEALREILSR